MRLSRAIGLLMIGGVVLGAAARAQQAGVPGTTQSQDGVYSNSVRYARGQSLQPVFEGWEKNADGTFSMWFGYLNRNYEERLNIPVGANNGFNGEDMGQAEVFEPRRSRFAFKVVVPANFPKDRDLVWTVTANGVTQKAFGSLWPVWEVDQGTISANRGSRTAVDFDEPPNAAPRVVNPPPKQEVDAGTPLSLTLTVEDDGNPRPRVDRGASVAGAQRRAGRTAAQRFPASQLGAVARTRHREVRSEGDSRRRRQGHHEDHVRQAGQLRPARVCGGCEHPHAARRQRDRPPQVLIDRVVTRQPWRVCGSDQALLDRASGEVHGRAVSLVRFAFHPVLPPDGNVCANRGDGFSPSGRCLRSRCR